MSTYVYTSLRTSSAKLQLTMKSFAIYINANQGYYIYIYWTEWRVTSTCRLYMLHYKIQLHRGPCDIGTPLLRCQLASLKHNAASIHYQYSSIKFKNANAQPVDFTPSNQQSRLLSWKKRSRLAWTEESSSQQLQTSENLLQTNSRRAVSTFCGNGCNDGTESHLCANA